MLTSKQLFYIASLTSFFSSFGMTHDFRFMPLYNQPRLLFDNKQHNAAFDVFIATAHEANNGDNDVPIPALYGPFDLKKFMLGIIKAGYQNTFSLENKGESFIINPAGKIQAQGIAFSWYTPLYPDWISTGMSLIFMRLNSYYDFRLNQKLDEQVRTLFTTIGLRHNQITQYGLGDIDWWLRFGYNNDDLFKFRTIDVGARLGILIPSGKHRDIFTPSSIPFGGDGHWGIYGACDSLFELREDLKVGFLLRINKRFARTTCHRLPVNEEPEVFGITTGLARVNPGVTFVFAPFIACENLREGMGASIQYTMTKHFKDKWHDERTDDEKKALPLCLNKLENLSTWGSDYFTLYVFYDFGKTKVIRSYQPVLSFRWDVPASLFITHDIPKTHRISLSIECPF